MWNESRARVQAAAASSAASRAFPVTSARVTCRGSHSTARPGFEPRRELSPHPRGVLRPRQATARRAAARWATRRRDERRDGIGGPSARRTPHGTPWDPSRWSSRGNPTTDPSRWAAAWPRAAAGRAQVRTPRRHAARAASAHTARQRSRRPHLGLGTPTRRTLSDRAVPVLTAGRFSRAALVPQVPRDAKAMLGGFMKSGFGLRPPRPVTEM